MVLDLEGCGDLFMTTIRMTVMMMTMVVVMMMKLMMVWFSSWQICGMQP